jgi:predicted ribosomally synthesized peptide with nif11-like leader
MGFPSRVTFPALGALGIEVAEWRQRSKDMSKSEVERLAADASGNSELQTALKDAGTDVEAVAGVARSNGYEVTAEELKAHAEAKKGELSEEQLEQVAGGVNTTATVVVVVVTIAAT